MRARPVLFVLAWLGAVVVTLFALGALDIIDVHVCIGPAGVCAK